MTWFLQDAAVRASPGRLSEALAEELYWLFTTDNEAQAHHHTWSITKALRDLREAAQIERARAWAAPFGEEAQRAAEGFIALLARPPFTGVEAGISEALFEVGPPPAPRYQPLSGPQHSFAGALIERMLSAPPPGLRAPQPLWLKGYQPLAQLNEGSRDALSLARAIDEPGAPIHAIQIGPFEDLEALEGQIEALRSNPHPNLPRCLAWGVYDPRRFWLATPRLRALTLHDLMQGDLSVESRLALLLQLLRGLEGLHALGLTYGARSLSGCRVGGDLRLKLTGLRWGAAPGDPREDVRALGRLARWLLAYPNLEALQEISERCVSGGYRDAVEVAAALAPLIFERYWGHPRAARCSYPEPHRGEAGPQARVSAFMRSLNEPLALSPDEAVLASCSPDGRVLLWDTATRLPFIHISAAARLRDGHLAFCPDGRRLVVVQDNHLQLWDARRGALLWEARFAHNIQALVVSPDGRRLALGSGASLWIRGLKPEAEAKRIFCDTEEVRALAFSPDGERLAVGEDGWIGILEGHTGARLSALRAPQKRIRALAFSPDGARLMAPSWGSASDEPWTWSIPQGDRLEPVASTTQAVIERRWPEARRSAPPSPNQLRVEGQPWWSGARAPHAHRGAHFVAFEPDEGAFISTTRDGTLRRWGRGQAPDTRTFNTHHYTSNIMAFSPEGDRLALAPWRASGEIWLLDPQTGELLHALSGHGRDVRALAFSPDGARLASGGGDRVIRVWDMARGALMATYEDSEAAVTSLAFLPDGSGLFAGCEDGRVRLWDPRTHTLSASYRWGRVHDLEFSSDGILAMSHGSRLWVMHPKRDINHGLFNRGGPRRIRAAFTADQQHIATNSPNEGPLWLWDLQTGEGRALEGSGGPVNALYGLRSGHLCALSLRTLCFYDPKASRRLGWIDLSRELWRLEPCEAHPEGLTYSPHPLPVCDAQPDGALWPLPADDPRRQALQPAQSRWAIIDAALFGAPHSSEP